MSDLSDEQWCVLDLLMRARQKGVHQLNRKELLYTDGIPRGVAVRLTMAALLMPKDLVVWISHHNFKITEAGVQLFKPAVRRWFKPSAHACRGPHYLFTRPQSLP